LHGKPAHLPHLAPSVLPTLTGRVLGGISHVGECTDGHKVRLVGRACECAPKVHQVPHARLVAAQGVEPDLQQQEVGVQSRILHAVAARGLAVLRALDIGWQKGVPVGEGERLRACGVDRVASWVKPPVARLRE